MSATWFDHAIATVAPRMAARRVMARQAFETLTRGYDGAARGRRTEGWRAPGSSADTEIGVAGALLRDRMRDLVRNNPHAAKAVAVLVNNIIGAGIMPRAASGDDTLDRKVDALFERWTADCDADGQLDFYGLQTLICREMVEAGEVLVRRRLRRASDGLPVPLQLQVLEADFLDATKSGALGAGLFFGCPMAAFATRLVPIEDLDGGALCELRDRLGAVSSSSARLRIAQTFMERRLLGQSRPLETEYVWRSLMLSRGTVRIGQLSEDLGWSRKRLVAHARDAFGLTPKQMARVARFHHAVDLARTAQVHPDWAEIAAACVYADQAHMVREFTDFAGESPERWRRRESAALRKQIFNTAGRVQG